MSFATFLPHANGCADNKADSETKPLSQRRPVLALDWGSTIYIYVGSYTSSDRNGRGAGISVFRADAAGEPWRFIQTVATENPSLLRTAPGSRMLYAAHGGRTRISAFALDPVNGRITGDGGQESGGTNPVDIGFLGGGRFLVTSNYTSGTLALLPVDPNGRLQPACQIISVARPEYGANEHAASMPHGVTVDRTGRFVLVPCKGLDSVFVFRFDPAGQLLPAEEPYAVCRAGSGPRHAVFHPNLPVLYVIGELGSCVQLFRWNDAHGSLHPTQVLSTLPATGAPQSAAAEIAISASGCNLYASNRGHDTIAHFTTDPTTGLLGAATWTPCQGREPRYFVLAPDGRSLCVANQESDAIVSFPLGDAGQLGFASVAAQVGSPSSICFAAPQSEPLTTLG